MKYLVERCSNTERDFICFIRLLLNYYTIIHFINRSSSFNTRNLALISPIFFLLFVIQQKNLLVCFYFYFYF